MTKSLAWVVSLTVIGTIVLATTAPGEARMRHRHRSFHHRHGLHHDQARGPRHEMTTPLLANSPDIRINSVGEVMTNVAR